MALRAIFFLLCLGLVSAKLLNLTCQQVREFVDGHNMRRLKVAQGRIAGQPAASNMTALIWDEELAKKAGNWADRKTFQHNPDKTIPSNRFKTGENLHIFYTTDKNQKFETDMSLKSWFDEHKYYKYKALSRGDFSSSKQTGHYTQMVWADTHYVGCAVSQYTQNGWNNFLVVCNYGPAGNYIDKKPYPSGKPSNKLICGARDCSNPYGRKCTSTFRSHFDQSDTENQYSESEYYY